MLVIELKVCRTVPVRERRHEERRSALEQMTQDASEAGLYGDTAEDYVDALKRARKRITRQENRT